MSCRPRMFLNLYAAYVPSSAADVRQVSRVKERRRRFAYAIFSPGEFFREHKQRGLESCWQSRDGTVSLYDSPPLRRIVAHLHSATAWPTERNDVIAPVVRRSAPGGRRGRPEAQLDVSRVLDDNLRRIVGVAVDTDSTSARTRFRVRGTEAEPVSWFAARARTHQCPEVRTRQRPRSDRRSGSGACRYSSRRGSRVWCVAGSALEAWSQRKKGYTTNLLGGRKRVGSCAVKAHGLGSGLPVWC